MSILLEEARRARAWANLTGLRVPPRGIVPPPVVEAFREAGSPWPAPLTLGRFWEGSEAEVTRSPWLHGIPVVYMIFTHDDELRYIGSTEDLPERLYRQREIGGLSRWLAWPMPSRADAFVAEDQWIRAYRPRMNVIDATRIPRGADRTRVWPVPADVVPVLAS